MEDKNALGGLRYVRPIGQVKRSIVHRYSFPPQDHSIDRAFQVHDPKTQARAGTVVAIDDLSGTIDIKRGLTSQVPHPAALVPQNVLGASAQHDSLMRLCSCLAQNGVSA